MNIKTLFNQGENITIESYLTKCGIQNVEEYIKGLTVEKTTHYDNIDEWCKALNMAINGHYKIYLLEDSDCDGLFSTSIQYMYCKMLNPNCDIEIIVHSENNPKAHGLDDEIMKYLQQQEPSYLFINDASTNDSKQCKKLSELGWIICCSDHHLASVDNPYAILVNNQLSENVINKGLSGSGCVWKCCKRYDEMFEHNYAKSLISYVALSLISDSMDLTYDENYSFIKWGRNKPHKNLMPFIEQLNKDGDYSNNKAFSFGMITCCNSLIRLGTSQDKLDLTYALCGEYANLDDIIDRCKEYHTKQANNSKKMLDDVIEVYNGKVFLGKIEQKTALTGLIANKLMSKYNKPILLVHDRENGSSSGSCRSPIDFKDILNDSGLFEFNEGHNASFGTSYKTDKEQEIIDYLDSHITLCEPCREVFISSTIKCLPSDLFFFNEQYKGYFGQGIPIPQVHIQSFSLNSDDIQVLGVNKTTIKFVKDGVEFIKFFCGQDIKDKLHIGSKKNVKMQVELIGELSINEWNGNKKFQCVINDIEIKDKNELTVDDIF